MVSLFVFVCLFVFPDEMHLAIFSILAISRKKRNIYLFTYCLLYKEAKNKIK